MEKHFLCDCQLLRAQAQSLIQPGQICLARTIPLFAPSQQIHLDQFEGFKQQQPEHKTMTWKTAEMGRKRSAARSQLSTLIDVDSVVMLMIVLQRSEALQPQELMIIVVQSKAGSVPSVPRSNR